MSFVHDGSSAKRGIANEEHVVQVLREDPSLAKIVYPGCPDNYKVKHLGGTKNKADILINDQGLSVKLKKDINNGSFDWVNTSAAFRHLTSLGYLSRTQSFLNSDPRRSGTPEKIVRETLKELTHQDLEELNRLAPHVFSQLIWSILEPWVIKPNQGLIAVIFDDKTKKLHSYDCKDSKLYEYFKNNATISFKERKKDAKPATSRTFLFNGEDLGIRIRVVLNNGVTALLGLSKANKTSQPVVKIQQDKVASLINNVCGGGLRTITL